MDFARINCFKNLFISFNDRKKGRSWALSWVLARFKDISGRNAFWCRWLLSRKACRYAREQEWKSKLFCLAEALVWKKKKIKLIKAKIRTCSCLWRNRGRNAGLRRAKKWDNRLQNEHEWTVSCSKKVKSSCYLDYTRNPHREHNLQQGVWESKPTARNDEGRGCLTLRTVLKNTNDSCQEEHKAKFGSR